MIQLTEQTVADIRHHAAAEYPREACGVVIVRKGRQLYVPIRNVAASANEHFVMDASEYALAEELGAVAAIVHSHPGLPPLPSQADLVSCERTGLPWVIVNWPTGNLHQFAPSGYQPPLTGRVFSHGVLDCLALIRDYYRETLQINMPDFKRDDLWWEKGQSLYLEHYEECGFEIVTDKPQKHDVLLMQVASRVPNHGAIYLGDGYILHHQMNRLSSRDVYGGWYEKITTHVLRHKEIIK